MQTMKQMIEKLPIDQQEQIKLGLRILWQQGFWDHVTRVLRENILENWDTTDLELVDKIRRFGADEKVYSSLKYLGNDYVEEYKNQQ